MPSIHFSNLLLHRSSSKATPKKIVEMYFIFKSCIFLRIVSMQPLSSSFKSSISLPDSTFFYLTKSPGHPHS